MAFTPTRRTVLTTGAAAIIAQTLNKPALCKAVTAHYAGVNIAGGEFGKLPGRYAFDYAYPSQASFNYFAAQGFNLVRIPFRWERLQPELNTELDAQELKRLQASVAAATAAKLTVVLDTHNYAKRRLASDGWKEAHVIGSEAVPTPAFADFCGRLASAFKDNNSVIFGLMNEPTGVVAYEWLPITNNAVAAIRAAGAKQLIFVPGVNYTGAHSWFTSGNDLMAEVVDPGKNFVLEVHQYLDSDASGKTGDVVGPDIGSDRLHRFQSWARANEIKAFLGEFGAGRNAQSIAALQNICTTMHDNRDVWMGWAAWAGGDWWPDDYPLNLSPSKDGTERPQMPILSGQAKQFIASDLAAEQR
ncbi:MAG: glycoside hydrolase family 5 protein [Proteobacteria bacterium]|nr:glycoside hydrolase family 5 protein [Pseudomonadota bacterium]